jgi:hypothetical protein
VVVAKCAEWTIVGIGASICLTFSGCAQHPRDTRDTQEQTKPIAVKQAPPTPIETKRVETGGPAWNPGWDTFIERSLPPAILSSQVPRDVRRFCPAFFEMSETDKRTYWAYFFQALAAAEAGLNAKANVLHDDAQMGEDRVTGEEIRSQGLLQLTYEDRKRYGCNFDWKADRRLPLHDPRRTILQPENNLACGINILDKQIISRHKPLFSKSSYWGTLRPGTISYDVFAKQMTNPPAACELHERPARQVPGRERVDKSGMGNTAAVEP